MNAISLNLRSIAHHERDHKGAFELAGVLDGAADTLDRLCAENERLRRALGKVRDWDMLYEAMPEKLVEIVATAILNGETAKTQVEESK